MKFACFADTPLHVLNSVNFVWHDIEGSRNNCDLFVHRQFSGFEHMIQGLKDLGIFANVYECTMPVKSEESAAGHAFARIKEIFSAKKYLAEWTGGVDVEGRYDILLMPAPLRFTVALFDVNRQADVWLYEDGLASYSGNLLELYGPRGKHLLKLVFNKGHETIAPTRMYVNNVDACKSTVPCDILGLPPMQVEDPAFAAALEQVFGLAHDEVAGKVVYLTQPLADLGIASSNPMTATYEETISALAPFADAVLVRKHPREKRIDFHGLSVDHGADLWELLCATAIDDRNVLVGMLSTAQLMPKLLFDKEPRVIFTHKLFGESDPTIGRPDLNALIASFKASYRNPDAVVTVNDMDEYRRVISDMVQDCQGEQA